MTSRSRFALSLASTVFVLYLASGPLMRKALGDTGYTQLSIFHEVVSYIRDAYVDPVNIDRTLDAAESGLLEALDGDNLEKLRWAAYQVRRANAHELEQLLPALVDALATEVRAEALYQLARG